jgi:phage-related protein
MSTGGPATAVQERDILTSVVAASTTGDARGWDFGCLYNSMQGMFLLRNDGRILTRGVQGKILTKQVYAVKRLPNIGGQIRLLDIRRFPPIDIPVTSIVEKPQFDTLTVEYGKGTEQREYLDAGVRWAFDVKFSKLTAAQCKVLLDFFIARQGNLEKFTFDHPVTHEKMRCRFIDGVASLDKVAYQLFTFQTMTIIQLDEVI